MNDNNIYYCNVHECAWDMHGKEYPIIKRKGSNYRYINFNDKQIGINNLPIRMKVLNFDDFCFLYMYELFESHPCPAMGYYVFRKHSNKKVSMQDWFKNYT